MRDPVDAATACELVAAAQAGDHTAWPDLISRYGGMLRSVTAQFRLQDADTADVVQSTWLHAVEQLDRLRQPERFGGWLKTIAYRECLAVVMLARREYPDAHVAENVAEPTSDPAAQAVGAETRRAVQAALDALPARRRILMEVLFYWPAVNYVQVAEAVDMPLGSVGPTRARTLGRLRAQLERDGFTPASSAA